MQRRHKKSEYIKRVAEAMKWRLSILTACLIAVTLVLMFGAGEALWPIWMIEYRARIIGIMLLIVVLLISFSPIIVESTSNTRHLSGPGKNPESGWGP